MKSFGKAALFSAVLLSALNGAAGAQAKKDRCDDGAPGRGGCGDQSTDSSFSNQEGDAATGSKMPRTMLVFERLVFNKPTIFSMEEDLVMQSDKTISITNLHVHVPKGITLTFRAPAVSMTRSEVSYLPVLEVSGTVKFEAVGSTPVLLDGNLVDEAGVVELWDDDVAFMSGSDDVVRYHANSITVSKREDTGDPGGEHDEEAESDQTTSTNEAPTQTPDDVKPSEWGLKTVLFVFEKLIAEPLIATTGMSAVWATKHGEIEYVEKTAEPSGVPGQDDSGGLRTSLLVAAHKGKFKRMFRARQDVLAETKEGGSPTNENGRRSAWGWVPFRSRHQKDVDIVREHLGEVEMTLSDRACVEVSVDGICVLAKSGPYKREWMNRFPWRRSKSNDYELHVTDDGMEVRLGERRVWGVAVDKRMG